MDSHQILAAKEVLGALATDAKTCISSTLAEGHLKVISVNALLNAGYSVIEGSNRKNRGRDLSFTADAGLQARFVDLPPMEARAGSAKKRSSPDIRVSAPVKLTLELQARSVHGSQSELSSVTLLDDIQRIIDGRADLFVLAVDLQIYESLLGGKRDSRGRKPKATAAMLLLLPDPKILTADLIERESFPRLLPFRHLAARVSSVALVDRVVLGLWYDDTALDPKYDSAAHECWKTLSLSGLTPRCC